MRKLILISALFISVNVAFGQGKSIDDFKKEYLNWYNKDLKVDKVLGVGVEKAYNELLINKKPLKTVIVAVIDGGVDINHEDLKGKIWTNEEEIPGNGVDDDQNGYVDDVHGWNFLGNENGDNVSYENYEYVRIIRNHNVDDDTYERAQQEYDKESKRYEATLQNIKMFKGAYLNAQKTIEDATGVKVNNADDIKKLPKTKGDVADAVKFLKKRYKNGFTEEDLDSYMEYCEEQISYYLNKDFDARSIVGDDPQDLSNNVYGNNQVNGPTSFHGTFVSGIIAANRNNGMGIDGIAENVKIMPVRVVPDGDERDKDVALGIRYAVDNGASIINMSFGKSYSPYKKYVDEAVKYAEEKGVLLIHSAGNDASDNDAKEVFPNKYYLSGGEAKNWLTIGANSKDNNKKLTATFTNYGKKTVDFFAPGVDIVSLDTLNSYKQGSGTSFSSPVVSGVAALVLSYYPELKAPELIDILYHSLYITGNKKVYLPNEGPGKKVKTKFEDLTITGGIVNAYQALEYADSKYGTKGK